MANSVDPDPTAPIGAVCSWSTLFDSILNLSVMLGDYLPQMTSADDIFRFFFLVLSGLKCQQMLALSSLRPGQISYSWEVSMKRVYNLGA